MNEIGLKLKEKREENGVSIEEAATDLKVRPSQLASLEAGKKDDFKDVLFLKYLIRDYAKYLGLDSEQMVDSFNEFLFDYTSKIPVEAIEEAKKNKKDNKVIVSPYTSFKDKNLGVFKYFLIFIIVIVIIIAIYFLIITLTKSDDFTSDDVTYAIGGNVSE